MLKTLAKMVALAALGWVCSAHALGLGEIEIKSRLNQPLSAVIPISSATPRELESLNLDLASNEDFERAGMERAEFLSSLTFEIKDNVIRVVSKDLAREPFVSFLLDVRWSGGRLLREYTMLLDPPTLAQTQKKSAPNKVQTPPALPPRQTVESSQFPSTVAEPPVVVQQTAPAATPAERRAPTSTSVPKPIASPPVVYDGETYGPIQPKETLWSVAYKLRPDSSLTMDQMQVAIFKANPRAFEDNRLTGLMKGAVIRIPSVDEIRMEDPISARAQVARANQTTGRAAASAPPRESQAMDQSPTADALAETLPTPVPPAAPATTTPSSEEQAAPVEQAPTQSAPGQADSVDPTAESAPAVTDTPLDPSQMVDEPAPAQPAADDAVQTEALPSPTAEPVELVGEPGPLDQILGPIEEIALTDRLLELINHPLALPIVAGFVALIFLAVLGRKLRDKYAQWSYQRASQKQTRSNARLMTAPELMAQSGQSPLENLEKSDAALHMREQQPKRAREFDPSSATATQSMAAETQQHMMEQTFQQTQAQTQVQEHPAARTLGPKLDFDVSGTYATETVQINLEAGDPLSEAEFHRAYGLYDEAALLLKQALQKDPARTDARIKLAEIYFESNKTAEFVQIAKELKSQLPNDEWQKIALLGSQIAAGDDLFKDATAGGTVDLSFDEPESAAASKPADVRTAPATPSADDGMLNFTLDDIKMPDAVSDSPATTSAAPAGDALEFDLNSLSFDTPTPAAAAPTSNTGGSDFKMDDLNFGDFDLKPETANAPAADAPQAVDLGNEVTSDEAPASGDEASTKLDLARAYMDMGDNDMARSLLGEVQQQGSAQQKKEAQELLSRVAA